MSCGNFLSNLCRRKTVVNSALHDTKLKRCLGIFDLIGLGVGSSLGVGIYVVTSFAIGSEAGPSYVISVIIAGVATLLAGLCYAEFSARLPTCGSAYMYTYVTLGEFCGFVIGWNLILEHVLSSAIAAKAWSHYLDFMLNGTINTAVSNKLGMHTFDEGVITNTPDVVAFSLVLVVTVLVALHSKISTIIALVLVFFNILIITCFVCIGYFHVNHENWSDSPGFFAHGLPGVLSGAATLMFTFTGLEMITSACEETREPSRTSSSAIMYSIFITSIVYFCASTAATLSLHNFPSSSIVALPEVLQTLKIHGASSVISIGGLIGLLASLTGALFYIPRQLYAMSCDRLIVQPLSRVTRNGHISTASVLLSGCFVSLVSLFVKVEILIQIVSIGTLLAYTTVAISVICLRYQPNAEHIGICVEYRDADQADFVHCTDFTYAEFQLDASKSKRMLTNSKPFGSNGLHKYPVHEKTRLTNGFNKHKKSFSFDDKARLDKVLNQSRNYTPQDNTYTRLDSVISSTSNGSISGLLRLPSDTILDPTEQTWRKVKYGLVSFILLTVTLCMVYTYTTMHLASWVILIIFLVFISMLVAACVIVSRQPQNRTKCYFHTPYVPFVPFVSIILQVFLLGALPIAAWSRFCIWMVLGCAVYFAYGYRHSAERRLDDQEVVLYEITDDSKNDL